jgi:hypothetical protein
MTGPGNRLDRPDGEPRMGPRMARMRGVRAPHRRTAHTAHPPIRGCAAGCAVGGANPGPLAPQWLPSGGEGGPPPTASPVAAAATAPPLPTHGRAVTLSDENALSRFRASPDSHRRACGPERAAQGPARRPPGGDSSLHGH